MNYLAHLLLADDDAESRVANLLGDFAKGPLRDDWSAGLRAGVYRHRRIDAFTDSHPLFLRSRRRLSARRRRFGGIIIDVCYDHFLSVHWGCFCDRPKTAFIAEAYDQLQHYPGELPVKMTRMLEAMIAQDWLNAYGSEAAIGLTLDRIAQRLRRPGGMLGAGEEFVAHYADLEQDFLGFFPQLIHFVEHVKTDEIC